MEHLWPKPPTNPLSTCPLPSSTVTAAVAPSLVSIRSGRARSSGFAWKQNLIVTADDTLSDDGETTVTLASGEAVPARIAGRDPTTDVALLRIEHADVASAPLGAGIARAGALVLAIGAEKGGQSAALGVVAHAAGAWRSLRGGDIDARIELDVRLRRSAEGGLVVDAGGQAIGMAVFGPRRRVLVIPTATIERTAARLEAHGHIARGYLGLGLQAVAVDDGGSGIMVMSVDPKGPSAVAGVRQGDILLAVDGEAMRSVQGLLRVLGPDSVGRTLKFDLRRAGEPVTISLTIAEKPTN